MLMRLRYRRCLRLLRRRRRLLLRWVIPVCRLIRVMRSGRGDLARRHLSLRGLALGHLLVMVVHVKPPCRCPQSTTTRHCFTLSLRYVRPFVT